MANETLIIMRPVILFEEYQPPGHAGFPLPRRAIFSGKFHQWGVNYEEFESGPGNFSTAIVEMPDGTIKNWPAELIRFDDAK